MTTIQQNNAVSSDPLMTAMNPKTAAQKGSVEETQDRFMTLLVTQMRNQDPLNPLDNAQVTSQFAQLSTVSGIEKLNQALTSLQSNYQTSQSLQAANMIGHGVLVPGSTTTLSDGKALLGMELTEPADDVKMIIRDGSGKAIHTVNLGSLEPGSKPLTWDGAVDTGGTAPDGVYTFEINATRGGQKVNATTLSFGEVASVTTGTQGVKLTLPGVGTANFSDVRQIL
jgi:flagellar basal-body rod modification protein FlgD